MTKLLLAAALSVCAFATVASAAPAAPRPVRDNMTLMNLTPTRVVVREIPARDFAPDKTPTSLDYALPEPGMGAVLGYKSSADIHPIQGYEVNQATAIGFSRPSSSVGAALANKF